MSLDVSPPVWWWIDSPDGYTYGVVAQEGVVVAAAIEGTWAIGMPLREVVATVMSRTDGSMLRPVA